MLQALSRAIPAFAAILFLSACSGSPGEIVTSTEDEVVVSISKSDAKNLDESLHSAGEIASEACDESDKEAKFDRTEEVADGLVAYFDCVSPEDSAD